MIQRLPQIGLTFALGITLLTASCASDRGGGSSGNPFLVSLNEPVDYSRVTSDDLTEYADIVLTDASARAEQIRGVETPNFENVVLAFDALYSELDKASNNSWMLFWVSPDSLTRDAGWASYQRLDSLGTSLYSDRAIFDQIVTVSEMEELVGPAKMLVTDLIRDMRHTGVDLEPEDLERYKELRAEINDLTSQYSTNMNSDVPTLVLDEAGAEGLSETFKARYVTDAGTYEIPVIPSNNSPVLNNAAKEETRRAYYTYYNTRAVDQNLAILDELRSKRHEMALLMGHDSYAEYNLEVKMANSPGRVWDFLNDLTARTKNKATEDLARMKSVRSAMTGEPANAPIKAWDNGYYRNAILKGEYKVDAEKIREYIPLSEALEGMMEIYQELLGLEFRKVNNPSVWHEEVELYEVYEQGGLVARFYLDLFPRPNKESWYYGVSLTPGRMTNDGYEIPVAMLLGNFSRPSDNLPSLVTHSELNTLFHEFGHIAANITYKGVYALQAGSRADFAEAMSQIFENWIWDYDVISSFARHYETGEVLPRETFDNMYAAKNVGSGLRAQRSIRFSVYDMMLYDRFDPQNPMNTDEIWRAIADRFVYSAFVEGTHPQSSWIHINTHPVYMYGYLWSRVYAEDMFTKFEESGLRDAETGLRYRDLILANGTQRPIDEVVEEFLGRPMNNEAYIRSLGLESTAMQ